MRAGRPAVASTAPITLAGSDGVTELDRNLVHVLVQVGRNGTVRQVLPDLCVGLPNVGVLGEFLDHAAVGNGDGRVHRCRHVNAVELTGKQAGHVKGDVIV